MIHTQFNILPAFCVLTRVNVSRFAIVLFAALLALWQGVVFGIVPDGYTFGPSTYTANVAEGTTETTSNLMIIGGVNEIIKTGGGTWIINKGLIYVSNIVSAPIFDLQTVDLRGAGAAAAQLVMHEGAALISSATEHDMNKVSGANVIVNFSGSGNILINDGKSFDASVVSGQYLVRRGARHILTDNAIASKASVKIDDATNSTLEYNVKSGSKRLDLTDGKAIKGCQVGSSLPYAGNHGAIEKTGNGTLPINTETNESVKAKNSVIVSGRSVIVSGRVDYQGYFDSFVRSGIDIQDGAVFSPGLSNSDTIGNAILGSAITLAFEAADLFEFNSYSDEPDSRLFDAIAIDKNSRSDSVLFKQQSDSFIELALSSETEKRAEIDAKYLLISNERIGSDPGASQILNDDCIYRMANQKDIFEF